MRKQHKKVGSSDGRKIGHSDVSAGKFDLKFTATEAGFKDGLGGASNSKGGKDAYHYILFGVQEDPQHPENSGVYLEFDDQSNGSINSVTAVSHNPKEAIFELKGGSSIEINCRTNPVEWHEFRDGIRSVFPENGVAVSET